MYRIQINEPIAYNVLLALIFTLSPPLLFATTASVCFARNCVSI